MATHCDVPTVDCAAKLVECGYAESTALELTKVWIRRGDIPGKIVTIAQMCAVLRAIPEIRRRKHLRESCRAVLVALEEAVAAPSSAPASAPPVSLLAQSSPPQEAQHSSASTEGSDTDTPDSTLELEPEEREPPGPVAPVSAEASALPAHHRQEREALPTARAAEATELCALLGVEEAVRVRNIGEGADKRFSLVDVARLVSGKAAKNALRDVRVVMEEFSEVTHGVSNFQFEGPGQRKTPVGDLRTSLLVVLRLRSRVAPISAKAADVLVRYLGGDFSGDMGQCYGPDGRNALEGEKEEFLRHSNSNAVTEARAALPQPSPSALPAPAADDDAAAHPIDGRDRSQAESTACEGVPIMRPLTGGDENILAELTDADVTGMRKTNEHPPQVSVYDVLTTLMGIAPVHVSQAFTRLREGYPEVNTLCVTYKFPGRGQQMTPVADARGIVRIIMLLPSRAAAPVRAKAADVLVRYLGGDPALVPEIAQNRAVQETLPQSHPARIFGETVEQESRVPPPPQEFHEAPHLEGGVHLYALGSQAHPRLFKTGSGKDPWERLQSEERKHKGSLKLFVVAVWWQEGHLEHLARRYLLEMPTDELAIQGTEYRMTSLREIKDATNRARLQYRTLANTRPRGPDEETEAQCKRRRLCLQVRREEFEMAQKELALEEQRFDLEKRRSSWRNIAQMLVGRPPAGSITPAAGS